MDEPGKNSVTLPGMRNLRMELDTVEVPLFIGDTRKLLAEMRQSVAENDMATLERLAHTLKSSAQLVGAMEMGELCQELEYDAAGGQVTDVGKRISTIELSHGLALAEIELKMSEIAGAAPPAQDHQTIVASAPVQSDLQLSSR